MLKPDQQLQLQTSVNVVKTSIVQKGINKRITDTLMKYILCVSYSCLINKVKKRIRSFKTLQDCVTEKSVVSMNCKTSCCSKKCIAATNVAGCLRSS